MIVQQIKKYYLQILLVLVVFVSSLSEPTIFSLGYYNLLPIRILLPLFILIYFVFSFKKLDFSNLYKDTLFKVLSLFVLVKILSGLVTQDFENYFQLIAFWLMLISFYSVVFFERKNLKKFGHLFSKYCLILLTILNLWGVFKYIYFLNYPKISFMGFMQTYKVSSIVADENHYSYLLTVLFFITIPLIFKYKSRTNWIMIVFLEFVTAVMMSATHSRSGVLSVIVTYFLFLLFVYTISKINLTEVNFKIFLLTVAFSVGIFFGVEIFNTFTPTYDFRGYIKPDTVLVSDSIDISLNSSLIEKSATDLDIKFENALEYGLPGILNEASFKAHLVLIYSGFRMGFENPMLGVGVGSFNEHLITSPLIKLYAKYDPRSASSLIFPPHSMVGEAVAETGITGLISYLLLLFIMAKTYYKNVFKTTKIDLSVSFFFIFLAYLSFSLFYNLNEEWVWLPLFTGLFLTNSKN